MATVEFKQAADGRSRLMVRINRRLSGLLALAIVTGVNFPAGLWSLACAEDP